MTGFGDAKAADKAKGLHDAKAAHKAEVADNAKGGSRGGRWMSAFLAALVCLSCAFAAPASDAQTASGARSAPIAHTASSAHAASSAHLSNAGTASGRGLASNARSESAPARIGRPSSTVPAERKAQPTVRITSVGSPILQPNEDLNVSAEVKNPSSTPITVSASKLVAQKNVPGSRSQVLAFLHGSGSARGSAGMETLVERKDSVVVPAGSTTTLTFTVRRSMLPWGATDEDWGPRGVEVSATIGERRVKDRSIVVMAPTAPVTPMPTAALIPLTSSPAEIASNPSVKSQAEHRTPTVPERIPRAVKELSAPGVTLALDPLIADVAGADLTKALASFSRERATQLILTAPGDSDVAARMHGCDDAGELNSCAKAHLDAEKALASRVSDDISARLNIDTPRTDIALLPPQTDSLTATGLASAGGGPAVLSGNQTPIRGKGTTPSARMRLPGTSTAALASDTAMSAAFSGTLPDNADADSTPSGSETLDALDARQLVLGLSAATYRERPSTSRVTLIEGDRAGMPYLGQGDPAKASTDSALSPENMGETVRALMSAPWVAPTTVSGAFDQSPSTVARSSLPEYRSPTGMLTRKELERIDSARKNFDAIVEISGSKALLNQTVTARAYSLTGVAWRASRDSRTEVLKAYEADGRIFLKSIAAERSSTINIISTKSEIPIHVGNSLPVSVTVWVELHSRDPRLKAGKKVKATLAPSSSTKVLIPVRAFGSGNITADVRILNEAGASVGVTKSLQTRVRSDWENIGTGVFLAFFLTLLIVGTVKSLRKGRRSRSFSPEEVRKARREAAERAAAAKEAT